MPPRANGVALLVVALCALLSCRRRDLRGWTEPSRDGRSYLSVDDDNGGGCVLFVDERPVRVRSPILVTPGTHKVDCHDADAAGPSDISMPIVVPARRIYHFDYWGP
jgi:hypothetical protein